MACALLIALVDILFPVVTRKVLYEYIPGQMMRTFAWVMLGMLALFIVRMAAQWFVAYLGHMMGVRIEADMRAAIFAHLQKLGFMHIHWIDFVVVDNWPQTRAGKSNFRLGIFFLQIIGMHTSS